MRQKTRMLNDLRVARVIASGDSIVLFRELQKWLRKYHKVDNRTWVDPASNRYLLEVDPQEWVLEKLPIDVFFELDRIVAQSEHKMHYILTDVSRIMYDMNEISSLEPCCCEDYRPEGLRTEADELLFRCPMCRKTYNLEGEAILEYPVHQKALDRTFVADLDLPYVCQDGSWFVRIPGIE